MGKIMETIARKEYIKNWATAHQGRRREQSKRWKAEHPERVVLSNRRSAEKRRDATPWSCAYRGAQQRCTNPKAKGYHNYGGKGILFKMTITDFEHLWFRDNAFMMDRPSIDRKNSDKDYELSNCRFIELTENISRAARK